MKKKNLALRDSLIAVGIIAAILVVIALVVYGIITSNNVAPSLADIMSTVINCAAQLVLIVLGLVLIVVVVAISANKPKETKIFARCQGLLAGILAILCGANWICYGPLNALISVTFSDSYGMSEETKQEGLTLNETLSGEGIVLLKNENNALPLNGVTNLNVFGWSSVAPVYGGAGSGTGSGVNTTLLEGLANAGFTTNSELSDFYTSYNTVRPLGNGVGATDRTLPEPSVDSYGDDLISNAKSFSDTALIVISREGGEDQDLPMNVESAVASGSITYNTTDPGMGHEGDFTGDMSYLELSNTERSVVEMVCENFDNVVVIINSSNPMELGWLDEYDSIQAALLVPGTGVNGFNSLGNILNGSINPSGRTVDTYVYDLLNTPTSNNFGNFEYNNVSDLLYTGVEVTDPNLNTGMFFVNYVEGIYVGYKYYETAAVEGFIDYDTTVQYPFGYGLSYTSFDQKISNFKDDNGTVTVDVTVTNTGTVAGKDVVELYYNPPYYNGGIEKAAANLLNYGKTGELQPGASETVSFTFTYDDLASYDTYGNGCYVTEHGDYEISIRSDSHNILDSETITIDSDIIYNEANAGARASDNIVAENVFDYAEGNVTYLSRANGFANYAEATAAPSADAYAMTDEQKATLVTLQTWIPEDHDDASDVMPTTGAKNGLTIYDMEGLDYDDPKWDTLLDEMTFDEMATLVGVGGYQTAAVSSIGLPATVQSDGPSCLNANMAANVDSGVSFCCGTMIGQTWNKDLAYQRGSTMGKEADEMHISGWYGPATDTHRSAFSGRNFEYYSEDGVLAGYMCANEVQGARDNGLLAYMKHFALNDQETNRVRQIMTWANEQSIREIYLKSFELGAKVGHADAVMSSFNFIGNKWAGGTEELLQTILRDEWGFQGVVVTDWYLGSSSGYMDANLASRSGGDQMLSTTGTGGALVTDTSATATIALRNSCHNILYALAQSNLMKWENNTAGWELLLRGVDIAFAVIVIAAEVILILNFKKKSGAQK
jgi:beta-glucosidase